MPTALGRVKGEVGLYPLSPLLPSGKGEATLNSLHVFPMVRIRNILHAFLMKGRKL